MNTPKSNNINESKSTIISLAIILFLLICIAYSNHFTNGFEFDDSSSIVTNGYIRDLKNIPLFFTDIKCFGTNMNDLGYRPIVALLNAISYWLAGGLNPVYFHASIFFWYLVQLVLMFFIFKKIFEIALNETKNTEIQIAALVSVGLYGVHTSNAETINYIISISDSFSTLCIVASLLLYIIPITRKFYLYILTTAIGIGTKETGVMFGPILFFYILLFEENVSLTEAITFKKTSNVFNAIKKAIPSLLFSFGLFYIIRKLFIPEELDVTVNTNTSDAWNYFYTQWVVIVHYLANFIIPLDLSIDPDFALYKTPLDAKVILSLVLLLSIIGLAFYTSKKKETRPISFGILWFFIALAPTSTIIPFSQVSNDHRTFFPYIGLVMSLVWFVFLQIKKYKDFILKNPLIKLGVPASIFIVLALYAFGTYQRNKVWSSPEMLWRDATIKGPNNPRAQMNYGLELMGQGKYEETLPYFERTLAMWPHWSTINVNMAILKNAMGYPDEAETYFKNAIRYQPEMPNSYLFYARWLKNNGRTEEAILQLEAGNKVSPGYTPISELLANYKGIDYETIDERIKKQEEATVKNPTEGGFIDLSLTYYKKGMYKECIDASEKALKFNPDNSIAYNNICSAYCSLGEWKKAEDACNKALQIDPNFELAKNNLNWAKGNLK